jgi:hypothetical protein
LAVSPGENYGCELYPNGIDADTGAPIDGDQTIDTDLIAEVARRQRMTPEDLKDAAAKS